MGYWWKSVVKDYLTFSRRDKAGIFLVMMLITIGLFIPRYFRKTTKPIDKHAFVQELAQLKISVDSSPRSNRQYQSNEDHFDYFEPKKKDYETGSKGVLFAFDPNTLSAEGWRRLGVKEKTIQTIQKFIVKGFKFKQPGDIDKIYGLSKEQAERLKPYVKIATANYEKVIATDENASNNKTYVSEKSVARIFDINLADSTDLIILHGIGSKLAARIVNYRNSLGGFASVAQVAETYGLPDSTFRKILPQLQCNQPKVRTININTADAKQLKAHPYINWNIANAIVRYREQHGNYSALNELLKIEIINDELLRKLTPYLSI